MDEKEITVSEGLHQSREDQKETMLEPPSGAQLTWSIPDVSPGDEFWVIMDRADGKLSLRTSVSHADHVTTMVDLYAPEDLVAAQQELLSSLEELVADLAFDFQGGRTTFEQAICTLSDPDLIGKVVQVTFQPDGLLKTYNGLLFRQDGTRVEQSASADSREQKLLGSRQQTLNALRRLVGDNILDVHIEDDGSGDQSITVLLANPQMVQEAKTCREHGSALDFEDYVRQNRNRMIEIHLKPNSEVLFWRFHGPGNHRTFDLNRQPDEFCSIVLERLQQL